MGCYGIGVSRTLQAVVEQNNDDNGIIWPVSIAPYHISLIGLNLSDEQVRGACDRLYSQMLSEKLEVLFDDRDERAGVKFKDADLLGIPIRIVVGPKGLKEEKVDMQIRRSKENFSININECVEKSKEILANLAKDNK